jgi:hypothetical protein
MGDPIEVRANGCEASDIHLENHDETLYNPHGRHIQCISHTITRVSNIRYFNAQQTVLDHRVKERHVDCALKEDIVVEGDEMYPEFGGFIWTWMVEGSQEVHNSNPTITYKQKMCLVKL